MALTWDDLNGKVQDKIIPTVADVVNCRPRKIR